MVPYGIPNVYFYSSKVNIHFKMIKSITKIIRFNFIIVSLFILSGNTILAQQVLLTSGSSWTVPSGVFKIRVECWGGGGGGGWGDPAFSHSLPYVGGGGGGGAYAMREICVTPGTTYTYSIGQGGSGVSGTNHGGDTWFMNTTTVMAQGGRGVPDNTSGGANGGQAASSVGDLTYSGGRGGNGSSGDTWGGGGGGAASTSGNGGNGGETGIFTFAFNTGESTYPGGGGGTGGGGLFSNPPPLNGQNYGGGGGGSRLVNQNGGSGASGAIQITMTTLALDAGTDVIIANGGDHATLNGSISNPVSGIAYMQDFSGCNNATCSNWTINSYEGASITATVGNNYSPCSSGNPAAKARIRSAGLFNRHIATLTSNTSLGISSGTLATLNFNYKCINYSNGTATPANNCTFTVAWSIDGGITWTNLPTFQNQSSATCVASPNLTFTPPMDSEVRIRITAQRTGDDFWVVIDDISLTQPNGNRAVSWSGGPVVSGGNTTDPTVNPPVTTVYTISSVIGGCPATDNVTVTVTSPLAITLSDFSASCDNKTITWTTTSEQNSSHFILEQSRNGYDWLPIERVEGAGTTNIFSNYLIKKDLSIGYYRLKQVDFDGRHEYFGPIHVDCANELHKLTAYPNPASETFTVTITHSEKLGESTILINDLNGKTVVVRDVNLLSGTNTFQFEASNLMPGTYIIAVKGKGKNILTPIKLIIQ